MLVFQIKYEYYNNCNLTEIGDPFAEQPYAVAVQQGSHLQEEISKVILELQKDRYKSDMDKNRITTLVCFHFRDANSSFPTGFHTNNILIFMNDHIKT